MKALSSLLALAAIVSIIFISANLFLQGKELLSYTLIIVWISSLILWVKYASSLISRTALTGKAAKA
jgi:hypothetical protein